MFTPVDYDFSAEKNLSDYGLEASTEFPFQSIEVDGNVLRLVALAVRSSELIIKTDAGGSDISLMLKVKNLKGNASTKGKNLISNSYIKTSTVANGAVIIFVNPGESFEFTGYSLKAD